LVSRSLALMLACVFVAFACVAYASEDRQIWMYSSVYGHERTLSRDADGEYSISVVDVTAVIDDCDDGTYRVCFSSRYLAVAIPKEQPEKGASWSVGPATFSVRTIVNETRVLGYFVRDLYVIDVERKAVPPLDTVAHSFRLFFSYSDGLLAFGELDETGKAPYLYFASRTPSLGASAQSPAAPISGSAGGRE